MRFIRRCSDTSLGFSETETLTKIVDEYYETTEYTLRRMWEARYEQPSMGNPLFEDVPMQHHIIHMMALQKTINDGSQEKPDAHLSDMIKSIEDGNDPFENVRERLKSLSQREEYETIDF